MARRVEKRRTEVILSYSSHTKQLVRLRDVCVSAGYELGNRNAFWLRSRFETMPSSDPEHTTGEWTLCLRSGTLEGNEFVTTSLTIEPKSELERHIQLMETETG